MANICEFEMVIKGKEENVKSFLDALQQNSKYCMGTGAWVHDTYYDKNVWQIIGDCRWSIWASLYLNAHSMKHQKETGEGYWLNENDFMAEHEFVDFIEASGKWNLEIEIVSWECGIEFSEHYVVDNGELYISEECEYIVSYDEETDVYNEVGGFAHLF